MLLAKLFLMVLVAVEANVVHRLTAQAATVAGKVAFRFANMYGDHMVLQAKPFQAMVWGFGELGQEVTVRLASKLYTSKVIKGPKGNGVWTVTLDAQDAGGPYTITAMSKMGTSTISVLLEDVLFGDVWICSGQSNMQFTVHQVINVSEAIKAADHYPDIRLFTASLIESPSPLYELRGVEQPWSIASSKSVDGGAWKYFSAVCWFYGKNIYDRYKSPLGLIATDWGGTPVEAWSSPDSLRQCNITAENAHDKLLSRKVTPVAGPQTHSVLYNSMVHPFLNMTIYGAIWYQGEANAAAPSTYNCTFPAMIDDWRSKWYDGTNKLTSPMFPFGFVQLSSVYQSSNADDGFPIIRWAQTANYGYVPNIREKNVFMAVAMDLGNKSSSYGSIHPPDKQDVGYRLALAGQAIAYGETDVYFSGPLVSNVMISVNSSGSTFWVAVVEYQSVGNQGIELRSTHGFQLYCVSSEDPEKAKFTDTKIISTKLGFVVKLLGTCPPDYVAKGLRYAWSAAPCEFKQCAVYSKQNGLPSPPFLWNAPDVEPVRRYIESVDG